MREFPIGLTNTLTVPVTMEVTASRVRSGGVPTFSTPAMLGAMERCASESMAPYLAEGEGSVGMSANLKHMASTPVGMTVRVVSELVEQDRRRLVFHITAFDEKEQIGDCIHERFVIDSAKFLARAKEKQAQYVKPEAEN